MYDKEIHSRKHKQASFFLYFFILCIIYNYEYAEISGKITHDCVTMIQFGGN